MIRKYQFIILTVLLAVSCSTTKSSREIAQEPSNADSTSFGWKVTFVDDFDDASTAIAKGAPASCFSGPAMCKKQYWTTLPCAPEFNDRFKDLNKCTWQVYDLFNWMNTDEKEGEGTNSFHPSMVSIQNGKLILDAKRSPYPLNELDCKRNVYDPEVNWENPTKKCVVWSGGIESRRFYRNGKESGWAQEYGRFEVRAKLAFGPGSWPAHWLLANDNDPDGCGYPYNGEIDIMESYERNPERYTGSVHDGICSEKIKLSKANTMKSKEVFPNMSRSERNSTLYRNFHNYIVEWNKNIVRFYIDDYEIGFVSRDEEITGEYYDGHPKKGEKAKGPMDIPIMPHFWLLNTSIQTNAVDKWRATEAGKIPIGYNEDNMKHEIDYVKAYVPCTKNDDPRMCFKPKYRDTVYQYNSHHSWESAEVLLNAYPSPPNPGEPMRIRMTPQQDCDDLKLYMINVLGQMVPIRSQDAVDSFYLNNGPVIGKKDYYYTIETSHLAAGMYMVTAMFQQCGNDKTGKGNQVFKATIIGH